MGKTTSKKQDFSYLDLLKMYIGELTGLKEIGFKIKKDPRTFRQAITSTGIEIPFPGSIWCKTSQHFKGRFFKPTPEWMDEIIKGSMLGDAQIRLQSKGKYHDDNPSIEEYVAILQNVEKIRTKARARNQITKNEIQYWNYAIRRIKKTNTANFRIHKSILEFKWVKLMNKAFSEFMKVKLYVKPVNNKTTKWTCGFDTASSVQMLNFWKEWYTAGENKLNKRIPSLQNIKPNTLLHWYVDDGYYSGTDLSLCTHGFSRRDQEFLISSLQLEGIDCKLKYSYKKPHINISARKQNRDLFFSFLSEAKFYEKAKNIFPYKFTSSLSKKEWMKKIYKENPEYFIDDHSFKQQLLLRLESD